MINLKELYDEIYDIYNSRYKDGYQKFIPLFIRLKDEIINENSIDIIPSIEYLEDNYDDIEIDMDESEDFLEMWFWNIKYNLSVSKNNDVVSVTEKYNNITYNYKINDGIVFDFITA